MAGERHEWRHSKLGDVIELKRGYDLPQQHRRPGSVPIVSSSGLSGFHSDAMVKAPGVVTGRYGTLGEVFFLTRDFWPLNTTLYVRDFKGSDPKFVSYLLKTIDFHSCSDKAAVPGVNRNHLHELVVRVPPLPEQRAIAHVLGTLDDKIELNRKTNETLEAMTRALFKSWFVDFDPVRAKLDGRRPEGIDGETAALFPDSFEDSALGLVPSGWRVGSLSDLAEVLMGASPPGDTYNAQAMGTPLVNGPVEFGDYFTRKTKWTTSPARTCKAGDLIFCVRGSTTGRRVIADGAYVLGRGVAAIRALANDQRFINASIAAELTRLLTKTTGSVFPNLSRDDITTLTCLVPPARVRAAFHDRADVLLQLLEHQVRQQESLAVMRDTLLPKLMSGEQRVAGNE